MAVLAALLSVAPASPTGDAPARHVGVEVCGGCHSRAELGDQMAVWTGSMHARTFLVLATGRVEMVPPQARGLADVGHGREVEEEARRLGVETNCLGCHGPGSDLPDELRAETYHVEDGVQCEVCHGPGSRHVEAMGTGAGSGPGAELPAGARMPPVTRESCQRCHRPKPTHAVLDRAPFDAERAWTATAHPIPLE